MFRARIKDELYVDVPDELERVFADFEPCTTALIAERVRPGDVVLDIGANFGFFSVLSAALAGERGRVFAVEASPSVLPILQANTQRFANVRIIHSAVGDRTGTTDFYLTEDFVNSGVSQSPFIVEAEKITVPIDTLDRLLGRQPEFDGRLDFIKCDVQGDEMAVLAGLHETIARNERVGLIAEWAPPWMRKAGYDPAVFPDFLRDLGFERIVVVDDYLKKQMTLEEMQEEFRRDTSGKRFCNVFASKGARGD